MAQSIKPKYQHVGNEILLYKLTALQAQEFLIKEDVDLEKFATRTVDYSFPFALYDEAKLPLGSFLKVEIREQEVIAEVVVMSNLQITPLEQNRYFTFNVVTKDNEPVQQFNVFFDGKRETAEKNGSVILKYNQIDHKLISVFSPGDTSFFYVERGSELQSNFKQRLRFFKSSKFFYYASWPVKKAKQFWKYKRFYQNKRTRPLNGFVVLNQPKYKPLDTVLYKIYLRTKHGKASKKKIFISLKYSALQELKIINIDTLRASTPGAYFSKFVLGDSLPANFTGKFEIRNHKNKFLFYTNLIGEDYQLPKISTYTVKSDQESYNNKDTITISASAKDANGYNLLDGTAQVIIITNKVIKIYDDMLTISDTLYKNELKLEPEGETTFKISTEVLPKANLALKMLVIFKNGNNESKIEEEYFSYYWRNEEIFFREENDSIKIDYRINGEVVPAKAILKKTVINDKIIDLPYRERINPLLEKYTVMLSDSSITKTYKPKDYYMFIIQSSSHDTLTVVIENAKKLWFNYTLRDGNTILEQGRSNIDSFSIVKKIADEKKMYVFEISYYWLGEEQLVSENVGLLYRRLTLKTNAKTRIEPGEQDSIVVKVEDYKGKPVKNVNITSASYNKQFTRIVFPTPRYNAKYKRVFAWNKFDAETPETAGVYLRKRLDQHKWILAKTKSDSLKYYQLLYPGKQYEHVIKENNLVPLITVNIVDSGRVQPVHMLHINNAMQFTTEATFPSAYLFNAYPGYTKFRIRLADKIITIDSIYVQTYYRYDFVFDLQHLPPHSKIENVKPYWTDFEISEMENRLWQTVNEYHGADAFIWQGNNVIKLNGDRRHLVGPFGPGEKLQFFKRGDFDLEFIFEPGYEYRLSKKIERLEKKKIFPVRKAQYILPTNVSNLLRIEDTLVTAPVIEYPVTPVLRQLMLDKNYPKFLNGTPGNGTASLQLQQFDTTIQNIILKNLDSSAYYVVLPSSKLFNITPGKYAIFLVTNNFFVASLQPIELFANSRLVIDADKVPYSIDNALLDTVDFKMEKIITPPAEPTDTRSVFTQNKKGGATLYGNVYDAVSKRPIPGLSITILGSGTAASDEGDYRLEHIKPGEYIIVFSAIGYYTVRVPYIFGEGKMYNIDQGMKMSAAELSEIVVTAYAVRRQVSELGYSTAKVTNINLQNRLTGKVSGFMVNNGVYEDKSIQLRGIRSLSGDNEPLLVVDGIITKMEELSKINQNDILETTVLKSAAAIALFGPEGVNGAIMITTGRGKITERKTFRDYGYWMPNILTNKNGEASFKVTYPDNVTGWQNYILGVDKKYRSGVTQFFTQAIKPIVAEIGLPEFLVEGDKVNIVGKTLNYTPDSYTIKGKFSLNGLEKTTHDFVLQSKASMLQKTMYEALNKDTMRVKYNIETTTGYKDGEERKLPVFAKGTEEVKGIFAVLKNDTSFNYRTQTESSKLFLYAQNNTLDLVLEEIEYLKQYPYYCIEQTASKLTGYQLKKKIYEKLGKRFTEQKPMNILLKRLQESQLYNGGWSWWPNGKDDVGISIYVLKTLSAFRSDPLIEQNIRNGNIYLKNKLSSLKGNYLLSAISVLNLTGEYMDFKAWTNKFYFDSLSTTEQWRMVQILQQQKLAYQPELKKLMLKAKDQMLGGIFWAGEKYDWKNDDVATTLIALDVLKKEEGKEIYVDRILQYLISLRRNGYWQNTVSSATIANAVTDLYWNRDETINEPATITISGDTTATVNKFPLALNTNAKFISISKMGTGLVFFTVYEKYFEPQPTKKSDDITVETRFTKNTIEQKDLKAGESYTLQVTVLPRAEADYVLIEIPIPAGCSYANKNNLDSYYPQFTKEKVTLFLDHISASKMVFEIQLQARYSGEFTLNPAKASLMYYPVFYGQDGSKDMLIVE